MQQGRYDERDRPTPRIPGVQVTVRRAEAGLDGQGADGALSGTMDYFDNHGALAPEDERPSRPEARDFLSARLNSDRASGLLS